MNKTTTGPTYPLPSAHQRTANSPLTARIDAVAAHPVWGIACLIGHLTT